MATAPRASVGISALTTGINSWFTLSGDKACPFDCAWPAGTSARATLLPGIHLGLWLIDSSAAKP